MPTAAVAIVPAHNEAPRVAAVVAPLLRSEAFTRVVVVDDGSTDDTADAARRAGAHVLRLASNRGKGGAMLAGVNATTEPVVAFFDADLCCLQPEHPWQLVRPVVEGRAVMAVGLQDHGVLYGKLQEVLPLISGQRAVLRSVLARVPMQFWSGFGIEVAMNATARRLGPVVFETLYGLEAVGKWDKVGVARGMTDAARMARSVLLAMRDVERG